MYVNILFVIDMVKYPVCMCENT